MRFLLGLTLAVTTALPGFAQDDDAKVANCETNAAMVQQIVDMRQDRMRKAKVLIQLTEGETAVEERLLPVVPGMVDWIYGLKRKELKKDVVGSFKEACLSY